MKDIDVMVKISLKRKIIGAGNSVVIKNRRRRDAIVRDSG